MRAATAAALALLEMLCTDEGVWSMRTVESLYQEVVEVFHRSNKPSTSRRMRLVIANHRCDIIALDEERSSGYLKALRHLEVGAGDQSERPAQLTIFLMDSASTGVGMPNADLLRTPRDEPRKAFQNVDGSVIAILEGEQAALNIANLNDNTALLWLPSFESVPGYQLATPFRTIFNWLLCKSGYQLIHAAAIGFGENGMLLSGQSGSGKTVASLACLKKGAGFLGDDFVILGPGTAGGGTSAFSLYSSCRIHCEMMSALGLSNPDLIDDKALFFLYPEYSSQLRSELPIKSVFLPQKDNANRSCEEIARVNLVREVLIPTVAYLPGKENVVLSNLTRLLSKLPCRSVNIQGEPELIPDILRSVVAKERS